MNLAEARKTLTDSVLHVGETDYPADKLDRAIKMALQRFLRETRCNTVATDFTMTASSATQDVTTMLSDFLPSEVVRCRIGYDVVDLRNVAELMRQLDESTTGGQPEMIAWEAVNSALVYPIPDTAYVMRIVRSQPLVSWAMGTVSEVELNVPEQFVRDAIWWGASSALVYGETGSLYASEGWRRFEDLIKEVKGKASMRLGSVWKNRDSRVWYQAEGGIAQDIF